MVKPPPSINDVLQSLSGMPHHLDLTLRDFISKEPRILFKAIIKTISNIDKPVTSQKPPRSEQYLEQWNRYLDGEVKTLDKLALKYLCWESDVVVNPLFCKILVNNAGTLPTRAIKGLVSTIHQNWHKNAHSDPVTNFTVAELSRYSGKDRAITKWKSGVKMLLGKDAAASFAKNVLLDSFAEMKNAAELWAISEDTAFMRYSAVNAFEQALSQIETREGTVAYILKELFYWHGWRVNADGFRHMVNKLMLYPQAHVYSEELRPKILNHEMLGDPRLPVNRNRWLAIEQEAKQKFIGWLSKRDIVFFFDHVLKDKDRHGRRQFWLEYIDSMKSSRPFLSDSTAMEFRRNRDVNFGKLSAASNKAAFILDFGEVVVTEFSEVGMIYIYKRAEFETRVKDIWTNGHIQESTLKDQRLDDDCKIRHRAIEDIVYVDWRRNARSTLARYGVRP
jgi:hypothetical protein